MSQNNRADGADEQLLVELSNALIHGRQHIGPKRLFAPGPDTAVLHELLSAAAAAPDHGQLCPWRFLVLGPQARELLSDVFAQALLARDPEALPQQVAEAREKAFRGPVLLLAIADLRGEAPEVPAVERIVSLGCAIQNLLLAAGARGFGSGLSSGRALDTPQLREAFGVAEGEQAVCFISLGTPGRSRAGRVRPSVDQFTRWLD